MNGKECKFCPTIIGWLKTQKGKWTAVEANPIKRMGSDPLPRGKYYTTFGELFDANDVPNGVDVYRSHWGDCPGAEKARKN